MGAGTGEGFQPRRMIHILHSIGWGLGAAGIAVFFVLRIHQAFIRKVVRGELKGKIPAKMGASLINAVYKFTGGGVALGGRRRVPPHAVIKVRIGWASPLLSRHRHRLKGNPRKRALTAAF